MEMVISAIEFVGYVGIRGLRHAPGGGWPERHRAAHRHRCPPICAGLPAPASLRRASAGGEYFSTAYAQAGFPPLEPETQSTVSLPQEVLAVVHELPPTVPRDVIGRIALAGPGPWYEIGAPT